MRKELSSISEMILAKSGHEVSKHGFVFTSMR